MNARRLHLLRTATAAFLIGALVLLAGCGSLGGDQNTFAPEGDVAQKQRDLFLLVMWPALVIGLGVFLGLGYILFRYRRRREDEPIPKQVHGNTRLELAWTILPALLLIAIAVPTIIGIVDVGRAPAADALHVRVVAFQWDWRFEYLDREQLDEEGRPAVLFTSDELYIPVDREIGVDLQALDVLHSFWVPKLAGKLDVVPGRNNRMWFNATRPGVYAGQCAEFCGIGHAAMTFDVIAQPEEEFEAWAAEQLAAQASAGN